MSVRRITVDVPDGVYLDDRYPEYDAQVLIVIGAIVRLSAEIDVLLQQLYCGILDDAEAIKEISGKPAEALVSSCERVLHQQTDLYEEIRDEAQGGLDLIRKGFQERNRYVHDQWFDSPKDYRESFLVRSQSRTHKVVEQSVTLQNLTETFKTLSRGSHIIDSWIWNEIPMEARGRYTELLRRVWH